MAITVVETLRKALTSKAACHGAGTTVPILCELHLPLQYLMRDDYAPGFDGGKNNRRLDLFASTERICTHCQAPGPPPVFVVIFCRAV